MHIFRKENEKDISAIHSLIKAAFGQKNEADLVDALRKAGALTLSAVAVQNCEIVGHIAFSPVTIESSDKSFDALRLAPMAVRPDCQRQGIGTGLIRWSLDECRRMGHGVVIVLGHPEYYSRFGFTSAAARGIQCPFTVPSEAFMMIELLPDALGGHSGTIKYRPGFDMI
ncbi:MAG TPA: N-acetyltransferase [Thermoguttaceae bacterium]